MVKPLGNVIVPDEELVRLCVPVVWSDEFNPVKVEFPVEVVI